MADRRLDATMVASTERDAPESFQRRGDDDER
jgi:hypothetical protein